jgi:hypothetical protein
VSFRIISRGETFARRVLALMNFLPQAVSNKTNKV